MKLEDLLGHKVVVALVVHMEVVEGMKKRKKLPVHPGIRHLLKAPDMDAHKQQPDMELEDSDDEIHFIAE